MSECIFCKIVSGGIPAYKVYEDEKTLAFLDVFPLVEGHTIVINKKHGETLLDYEDGELGDLISSVKKIAKTVEDKLGCDGLNLGVNHREKAGQSVPHLHFHIIPRCDGDGGKSLHGIVPRSEPKRSFEEVLDLLKS